MSEDMLTQRRQWFESFPEGTIEFNLTTRILAVGMMGALAVLPENLHLLFMVGTVGILWIDALVIIWWVVQLGIDLETIIDHPDQPARQAHRRSLVDAFWVGLPTVPALLILSPWAQLFIRNQDTRASLMSVLVPILGVCFLVGLAVAVRVLRRLRLAATGWVVLWLVPVLHLIALHRIIKALQARIQNQREQTGMRTDERYAVGGSLVAADIFWLLTLLPWLVVLLKSGSDDAFMVSSMGKILIVLGTVLAAVFSAIQLSVMERLQRQFLGLIKQKNRT